MSRRLIYADDIEKVSTVLWDESLGYSSCILIEDIDRVPTVDAVEVVRCKDCEYFGGVGRCLMHPEIYYNKPNDYCSYGERRSE